MKAIVIENYGGRDQLTEKEIDKPELEDNQVLVELHATSINPIDWKVREGYAKDGLPFDFPIILGWDAAGIIRETGRNVTKFNVGDEVFARPSTTRKGTYAEYTAIDEELLAKKPENISFNEAAGVPLAGQTAWQALVEFGEINEGDNVLIHAGSGGVGTFAIQIAKAFGAFVATTASEKHEQLVKDLGADQFINYREKDFSDVLKDYDFVLDTIGGEVLEKSYRVLRKGGRLATIVAQPEQETAAEYEVEAANVYLNETGERMAKLGELIEKEKIKPVVGHVFPFTEQGMKEAHEVSESGHAKGKIVIDIK